MQPQGNLRWGSFPQTQEVSLSLSQIYVTFEHISRPLHFGHWENRRFVFCSSHFNHFSSGFSVSLFYFILLLFSKRTRKLEHLSVLYSQILMWGKLVFVFTFKHLSIPLNENVGDFFLCSAHLKAYFSSGLSENDSFSHGKGNSQ